MWKLTVTAEAKPAITFVAARTCFIGILIESFAAITTDVPIDTPSNVRVNVWDEDEVLTTSISVTTVVVDAGTVYRVVLDVAAAALTRALVVVAISYS
jgi:hypothetical protein